MLIKLINPNTTSTMTELMGDTARTVAASGSEIVLATSRSGAASIEGHYDEALSVVGVIDEIAQGKPADVSAELMKSHLEDVLSGLDVGLAAKKQERLADILRLR